MVFASPIFLFYYLPIVATIYLLIWFLAGQHLRKTVANLFLFCCSLLFYAWGEQHLVLLLLFSTFVDYYCAKYIAQRHSQNQKARMGLWISICVNLLTLGVFKYFNFAAENFVAVANALGFETQLGDTIPQIALPLGISFYTFQSMSYTIDVYRGNVAPAKSLIDFGCYVSLFPQLVAGPIVRYRDVAEDLQHRDHDWANFRSGVERFIIGLSKKVLLANTLATPADIIFSQSPENISAAIAWLGVVFYGLQIYFDFSGYSDMAIGLGRMFGFRFPENFNYPYVATSIQDFWRRWHISLSTWFRDYLYIPLGGSRGSLLRTCLNLWIVFLLCGFWHGASWNFVAWGGLHGLLLTLERFGGERILQKMPRILQHFYVLSLVGISWALFRAPDWAYATKFIAQMFDFTAASQTLRLGALFRPEVLWALAFGILAATPALKVWGTKPTEADKSQPQVPAFRLAAQAALPAMLILCFVRLAADTYNPFIYFRF